MYSRVLDALELVEQHNIYLLTTWHIDHGTHVLFKVENAIHKRNRSLNQMIRLRSFFFFWNLLSYILTLSNWIIYNCFKIKIITCTSYNFNSWFSFFQGAVANEIYEGRPCLSCHDNCAGFVPHLWR